MRRNKQRKTGRSPAGKRILCRVCFLTAVSIFLLYLTCREKVFPALCPSVCERLLEERQQTQVCGRIYKKAVKENTYVLYLDRIRVQDEKTYQEDNVSGSCTWETAEEECLLVYLSEQNISTPDNAGDSVPKIGQWITVCGTVSFFRDAPNPGNFNQKFYYQKQNIHAALWSAELVQNAEEEQDGRMISGNLREFLFRFRSCLSEMILEQMGERTGGMLCSMLLGETAYADEEIKENYQKSGIGHLLAISGLHVSFLGMGIYRLLRKAGIPVSVAAIAGSVILCCYVVMSGESVSSVRACVMFLIRMGAAVTGREYDGLTALSVAALVILVRNPLQLFDAGFLLSFGAMLGIYAVKPLMWAEGKKREGDSSDFGPGRFGNSGVLEMLRMSAAMQMLVLPVLLYYYYEICLYSVLWNLIAVPLASVIFGSGIAGVVLGGIVRCLEGSIFWKPGNLLMGIFAFIEGKGFALADLGLRFYEAGSSLILTLPGARWVAGQPGWVQMGIYYLAVSGLVIIRRLKQAEERGKRNVRFRVVELLCLGIAASALLYPHGKRGQLEIVMLNVGQGDCFFLRGGDGTIGLIDGGSSSVNQVGKYRLEPFLKSQGVGCLDYVWISHGDTDHVNGVEELLERQKTGVRIRKLILPPKQYWETNILKLTELAWEQGIPVYTMGRGQSFQAGKMILSCISPPESGQNTGNEASMVLSLSYGEFDMLFTGDLEKDGEETVTRWIEEGQASGELPESYEVLKVGHHGSRNATGEALLEAVRPSCAWISAGEGNIYGHPHEEVLERLANWDVKIYNTKDGSAVKLCTDGKKYCILIP